MSLNILITGSSGFLGFQLCKILSKTPNKVSAIDIKESKEKFENIKYIKSSINDFIDDEKTSLKSFDLIIHAASVLPFKSNKEMLIETNVNTTLNLIKNVANCTNTFLVYVSSSGVYGKPDNIPVTQETKFNPLDLYAETKITSENNLKQYLNNNLYSVIRPRTILGKNRKGIFEIFFNLIKFNIPIPLPNKGIQKIQFVEVEDLARLIIHIGTNRISGDWPAGAPNPQSLINHLEVLGKKLNKRIITININPKIFIFFGNILIKLKLINFTKWHFGSFPYDFYFDNNWKPEGFNYEFNNEETFLKSAFTFFSSKE